MATEADLIQKFKDLNIPVGADFEELIHEAFIGANLVDQVNSKADDSKVVHTADMRKPASDVAGIDEVNTKADDSKVVHTTDASNWQKQKITKDDGGNKYSFTTANTTDLVATIQALPIGYHTFYCQAGVKGNPSSQAVRGIAEITTAGNYPLGVGYLTDNTGDFWSFFVDSSGLKLKNKQDKLTITPADDSKVAHLSGANDFDTVPTVNNNPLLLASSLPSDLARTSQQTNFTNGLQSGGVDVATAADLKSLEDASWHTITGKSEALSAYTCMYRKNNNQKYVDLVLYGTMGITIGTSDPSKELLDLSEIISTPNKAEGGIACPLSAGAGGGVSGSVSISGTKILFDWKYNDSPLFAGKPIASVGTALNSPFLRVTFN